MKKVIRLTEGDLHSIVKNSVMKILSENSNPHPKAGYCEMYRKPQEIEQDKANFPKYFEELMNNGEVMIGCADKSFDLWLIQNHPEVEYDLRPCADYYERTKYYLK
jgi:hypothetical protein